jgi:hypothetical protein
MRGRCSNDPSFILGVEQNLRISFDWIEMQSVE